MIDNQNYVLPTFSECSSVIDGNTLTRNETCGENGTLIHIGFQLAEDFVKLIDVCYNRKRASTIYTRHIIQGIAIRNAMKSSVRPWTFKTTEVPKNFDAATAYTKAQQQIRFTEILSSEDTAKEILNKTYIARGHLAPDGDFLYVSWQFTTYYYINVAPQWQAVNNGNWKVVENSVRTKADQLKDDLIVFTGGHDILKLNDKDFSLQNEGFCEVCVVRYTVYGVLESVDEYPRKREDVPFPTSLEARLGFTMAIPHQLRIRNRQKQQGSRGKEGQAWKNSSKKVE